ncbi:MAG: hypothetical protein K9M44_02900 [Candidatus Pacebacteria bacterium]|nr:hypothetical protein [Candidatus Paceibacterota bacterium]
MNKINTFLSCLFCHRVPQSIDIRNTSEIKAICCLAFGFKKDNSSTISNLALAKYLLEVHSYNPLASLIAQIECAQAAEEISVKKIWLQQVISQDQSGGNYLDTYEVLRQTAVFCKQEKISKILLIAHPAHLWRSYLVAKKLGLDPVCLKTTAIPYDRKSAQWWTRKISLFYVREILSRLYYFFSGKI